MCVCVCVCVWVCVCGCVCVCVLGVGGNLRLRRRTRRSGKIAKLLIRVMMTEVDGCMMTVQSYVGTEQR